MSDKTFILEEALEGHEVDADIVLYNGKLLYAGVSDNFPVYKPFALETGHLMPSILDKNTTKAITEHAYQAALACGYDRGVLHIELMLKPDGKIIVLEVNGRLGGMYIADWHEKIWGVDLITAEMAISAGIDPTPFLQKKDNKKSLAQMCVTANQDYYSSITTDNLEIKRWINFQDIIHNVDVYHAEEWVDFPYKKDIAVSGHANIGEITVEAETPLLAFQKLNKVYTSLRPKIDTNNGVIESSIRALTNFCSDTHGINRFSIRQATNEDRRSIEKLLPFITHRASQNNAPGNDTPLRIPEFTVVLLAEDMMLPNTPVVGMLALHMWTRMRYQNPKTGYLHDLIVHPAYRNLGIAKSLIGKSLEMAHTQNIAKIDLACDKDIIELYRQFGFNCVGVHLAKYLEVHNKEPKPIFSYAPFSQEEIKSQGEWVYGQSIVLKHLITKDNGIDIPKHFFIPTSTYPTTMIDKIYSSGKVYSVKYSLHGDKAFSYEVHRGANSSRGRKLDTSTLSKEETLLRIKDFIKGAPSNTYGLVLQEFIDQRGGCFFHAEISTENIEIELLWENSTGRVYSLSHSYGGELDIYEEIAGIGEPLDRRVACKEITKRCKLAFDKLSKVYGQISWSIEGFWFPKSSKMTILQLRPTPKGRPLSSAKNIKGAVYSTNFTWGDYEVDPFKLQDDIMESKNIYLRKSLSTEELEKDVKDRLYAGQLTLLIDPFRGFALSHEKWFLPPLNLRGTYSFIYIPNEVIKKYSGCMVKILKSGRRGYLIVEENSNPSIINSK
jgi:ribosomal protein S18 acetylase RimI-like enzyme